MENSDEDLLAFRCLCGAKAFATVRLAGRLLICPACKAPVLLPESDGERARAFAPAAESERLTLAPATPRDWRNILPIRSDPANYQYELCLPDSEVSLRAHLRQHRFPRGFRKHRALIFMARRREDHELVGLVYLNLEEDHLRGSLGIMIHHPYHGKGFGREAVAAVVNFAMNTLRLHRLSASCDAKNVACCKVLESAGFRKEGDLQDWVRHVDRGWVDCCMYRILASDRAEQERS